MKMHFATAVLAAAVTVPFALAVPTVIEPDDFADGTDLTDATPGVKLGTAGSDNVIIDVLGTGEPDFPITSDLVAPNDVAPTGDRVFAHAGVGFFNDNRRFRADFDTPVAAAGILFSGESVFDDYVGRLEAYDSADNLIAFDQTNPLGEDEVELLSVQLGNAGIDYIVAWTVVGEFGDLDRFVFGDTIPEPTSLGLLACGALALRRRR
ncbi:MAG: hypothetical protein AAF743_12340 [Planctomycetota bacterium]